jgi:putative addiction module component (TIGR02574 family)
MKDPFPDIEHVFELGLLLSDHDREQLAQRLLDSLKGPDPEVERAWKEEVYRRMESVERGEVELIPHGRVMQELDDELRRWERDDAIEAALQLPIDDRAEVVRCLLDSLPKSHELSPRGARPNSERHTR